MKTEKFEIRFDGLSNDQRTNVWRITCLKCGKTHKPPTTMFAEQKINCPTKKCLESEVVNYNEITLIK